MTARERVGVVVLGVWWDDDDPARLRIRVTAVPDVVAGAATRLAWHAIEGPVGWLRAWLQEWVDVREHAPLTGESDPSDPDAGFREGQ